MLLLNHRYFVGIRVLELEIRGVKLKGVQIGNNHSKRDNSELIDCHHSTTFSSQLVTYRCVGVLLILPNSSVQTLKSLIMCRALHYTLEPLGSLTDEFWLFLKSLNQCAKPCVSAYYCYKHALHLWLFTKQRCHLDKMRYTGLA